MAKILIVEDDPSISTYIARLLESDGNTTLWAESAQRASDLLSSVHDIQCLVLDQNLGNDCASGLNLLSALRGHPHYRDLPVIVCTGQRELETVQGFLTHRIAAFIPKPFQPQQFLAEVHRVLDEIVTGKPGPRHVRLDEAERPRPA